MMKQYRIVTDGIRYRLQAYIKRWYHRKHRWVFCGINHPDCGFMIKDWYSLDEAQKGLACAQEEEKAGLCGYQPIDYTKEKGR